MPGTAPLRFAIPLLAPLLVAPARAQAREAVEVTASALNVRDRPLGQILDAAPRGTRLVATASQGTWLGVDWGGRRAWVSGAYVRRVAASAVEVTASSLNVRSGPSTADPRLGLVQQGQAYVELSRQGQWSLIQLDGRTGWVHRDFVRDLPLGGAAPQPAPQPGQPAGGWAALHRGLSLDGAAIPRRGLSNATLRRALGLAVEPLGEVVSRDGLAFVSGRVSHFGGPRDTGVSSSETGAITGERLRALNSPLSPDAATLRARPGDYYYAALRVDYSPRGRSWWAGQRLLVVAPATGRAIVVRLVDWGPNTRTGRVLDLSPQALRELGIATDATALVSFAAPGAPLGPVR